VNFQIWLFEEDDHIEVHFGEYSADAGAYGQPDCNSGTDGTQFAFHFDACGNALSLTGPAALPSYDFRNHCIWQPGVHVSGTPPSGAVYSLIPETTGIEDAAAQGMRVFPVPTTGVLHMLNVPAGMRSSMEVSDLHGRTCLVPTARPGRNNEMTIDVSGLRNGIYHLNVSGTSGSIYRPIFIKTD
jgi:hypothetical protein